MVSVCHVITRMILGGAQENTFLTVRGLHEDSDFQVDLVTGPALGPEGELLEEARGFGVNPVLVPPLRRAIRPWLELKSFRRLYRLFRSSSYDIVHTHSSKAGILGRWAARLAGVPWIVHTVHGLPFHRYQPPWKRSFYRSLERAAGGVTHVIYTVCDRMAEKASRAGVRPMGGFETVYSGMELKPFLQVPPVDSEEAHELKREWGFSSDTFVIGKIARLFRLKGHRYCLRAFRAVSETHPEARLLLVGDGVLREDLERQALKLGIRDRVTFAGLIPYRRIPEALGAMDALVHASLREGLARVIPQAQAAGRPVVSYNIDGAPEAISHGESGLLVPPKSVSGLAGSMRRVIEDDALRNRIIDRGREWVHPRFDWRHMVQRLKRSYRHLLSTGSARDPVRVEGGQA